MFMCDCFRTVILSDQAPLHQEGKRCDDTAGVIPTPGRICNNRCRYRICASWSAYQFTNYSTQLSWFVPVGGGLFWPIIWPGSQFIKARCSLRLQLKKLCVTVFEHFSSFLGPAASRMHLESILHSCPSAQRRHTPFTRCSRACVGL